MEPRYIEFSSAADRLIPNGVNRSKIIGLAVAQAVANSLSLPTSQADSASAYYNTHVAPSVRQLVGRFNENLVFDAKVAMDNVQMFWMIRYTAAHPISRPIYSVDCCFFESIVGVNLFVPPDVREFADLNKQSILMLSSIASEIIYSMGATDA
jgi:hypothetical protein